MTRHIARPPRVRFPNVERRTRGGVFVFRARVMHAGRTEVGPWRSTQREAFLDVEGLRAAQARRSPTGPVSIVRAVAAVVWDARARGLQRITIRRHLLYEARWWLEWWEGEDPLELVDEEAVLRVVRAAMEEGDKSSIVSAHLVNAARRLDQAIADLRLLARAQHPSSSQAARTLARIGELARQE